MFQSISSITVFLASLKHPSSTSDADASIKWSSASVASSDSCCILDRCLRHNLEKKPRICMFYRTFSLHLLCKQFAYPLLLLWVWFLPVSHPILNFCFKYCLTFCESRSLAPLLWRAHPMGSFDVLVKGSVATATSSVELSPSNDNDWKWWTHYLFTLS